MKPSVKVAKKICSASRHGASIDDCARMIESFVEEQIAQKQTLINHLQAKSEKLSEKIGNISYYVRR